MCRHRVDNMHQNLILECMQLLAKVFQWIYKRDWLGTMLHCNQEIECVRVREHDGLWLYNHGFQNVSKNKP